MHPVTHGLELLAMALDCYQDAHGSQLSREHWTALSEAVTRAIEEAKTQAWRPPPPTSILWEGPGLCVEDYGEAWLPASAPVVLCVPSMINGPEIFDMTPSDSFLRHSLALGYRPWLCRWTQDAASSGWSLDDYATQGLGAFLASQGRASGKMEGASQVLHAVTHCLGGVVALASLHAWPGPCARMVSLALPWRPPAVSEPQGLGSAGPGRWPGPRWFGWLFWGQAQAMMHRLLTIPPLRTESYDRWSRSTVWLEGSYFPEALQSDIERWQRWGSWDPWLTTHPTLPAGTDLWLISGQHDKIVTETMAPGPGDGFSPHHRITLPTGHIGMLTQRRHFQGWWTNGSGSPCIAGVMGSLLAQKADETHPTLFATEYRPSLPTPVGQ